MLARGGHGDLFFVGRSPARAIDGEPALADPWLRTLVGQLNRVGA